MQENLSLVFANNKCADQSAPLHSLISTFVICLLEGIISKLATSEISIFYLVSVAEETDLSLTLSDTTKTGFVQWRPILQQSFQESEHFLCCFLMLNYVTNTEQWKNAIYNDHLAIC